MSEAFDLHGLNGGGELGGRGELLLFRALAQSGFLNRLDFAAHHGFQYGSDRDLYKALGYQRDITLPDYRERYERGGVAKRIVDAKPQATWREPPEVKEDRRRTDRSRPTTFERTWSELEKRLCLFSHLERVDKLAGLGHYGILLLGLRDGNRKMDDPAGRVSGGPRGLLYVQPYAEEHASIERYDEDPKSERFGKPVLYKLRTGSQRADRPRREVRDVQVHWTRVVHIADGALEDDVIGTPRLRPCWNLLDDLFKVVGSVGEMFWRGGYGGLQLSVDPGMELKKEDKEDLDAEFKEYEHGQRRYVRTRGVTMKPISPTLADPRGAFTVITSELAGTVEIPLRILFGSERGELASQQDRHNWNERVAERQHSHAEPKMLRALTGRLLELQVLPRTRNEHLVEWPDLLATPEDERSQIAQRYGQAAQAWASHWRTCLESGVEPLASQEEIRDRWFDLEGRPPAILEREPPEPSEPPTPPPGAPTPPAPPAVEE